MFGHSTPFFLVLCAIGAACAACAAERDACEQIVDKQLRLIAAEPDLAQREKDELDKELRAARGRIVDLCRDALARDGAAARRAADCSLRASSLRDLSACPSSPTFVQGAHELGLGSGHRRSEGVARRQPQLPPTPAIIVDDAPAGAVVLPPDAVPDPLEADHAR